MAGAGFARNIPIPLARLPFGMKIGRLDADSFGRFTLGSWLRTCLECHLPPVHDEPLFRKARGNPSGEARQIERWQVARQTQIGIDQRKIQRHFSQRPIGHTNPRPQRAPPMRQRKRIVDPLSPDSQIDLVDFGKSIPGPISARIDIAATEIPAHINRRSEFRRRPGSQSKAVSSPKIVKREVQ